MLTEAFIEALLVDEDLADQVWALWDQGEIGADLAFLVWLLIAVRRSNSTKLTTWIAQVCANQDCPVGLYPRNRTHTWKQNDEYCVDLTI